MPERNFTAEAKALLAQGRRRAPEAPSEITDADFQGIQRWLGDALHVTRQQIAEAFSESQRGKNKKPVLNRGTWQGRKECPDFASVQLTNRAGARDLSYDVRVGTTFGRRVPSVTQPQGKLSGPIGVGKEGRASGHRFSGGVPEGSEGRKR